MCDVDALGEHALGRGHAFLRGGRVAFAVHGNELAQLEAVAKEGKLENRALGEGGGAPGNARNQARRVEVRDVVGHEDARLAGGNVLAPSTRTRMPAARKATRTMKQTTL